MSVEAKLKELKIELPEPLVPAGLPSHASLRCNHAVPRKSIYPYHPPPLP